MYGMLKYNPSPLLRSRSLQGGGTKPSSVAPVVGLYINSSLVSSVQDHPRVLEGYRVRVTLDTPAFSP